jgi:hypothetical protein
MYQLKQAMPLLKPFLKLLGADTSKIDNALSGFDELKKKVEELSLIPDRFNDLFGQRGWIIYETMNLEVAKEAIKIAQEDDIDKAEAYLVDYYNPKTVRNQLRMMSAIKAFNPRKPLVQKALLDYEEERYHACIPVILAMIDGLVNELHEKRHGFFAQDTDLTAWDSIAGHSKGLNVLSNLFKKGRKTTNTEKITIPYRHGIMHGIDLAYDNQIVAAKTWAALFAIRDWAIKAERDLLKAQKENLDPSWRDILQQIKDNEALKKELEQWKPRVIDIGVDIPASGEPDAYPVDTPERKVSEYLSYWKAKNYGFMANCLAPIIGSPISPSRVRSILESKELKSYEFTELNDVGPAATEIKVDLALTNNDKEVNKEHKFRVLNLDSEGRAMIRRPAGNNWMIMDWEIY